MQLDYNSIIYPVIICSCFKQVWEDTMNLMNMVTEMSTSLWFIHQKALSRWVPVCFFFFWQSQSFALKSQGEAEHLFLYFVSLQYKTLLVFDTSKNETRVIDAHPDLSWKDYCLPSDKPENPNGNTCIHTDGVEVVWIEMLCFTVAWKTLTVYSSVSLWLLLQYSWRLSKVFFQKWNSEFKKRKVISSIHVFTSAYPL